MPKKCLVLNDDGLIAEVRDQDMLREDNMELRTAEKLFDSYPVDTKFLST